MASTWLLARFPIDAGVQPTLRSERLLRIRHELAASGHLAVAVPARDGGDGCPALVQTLMQFICGYHDIDLRDATGLGHGRLIAAYASAPVRDRWLPFLLAGALAGIAVTETHGGSQVHATSTTAVPRRDGTWAVSGTKTWISRLDEAAVFCVFFKDPAGRLTAGQALERMAALARVRPADTYGILAAFGRDCAGAIMVLPDGDRPGGNAGSGYSPMTPGDLQRVAGSADWTSLRWPPRRNAASARRWPASSARRCWAGRRRRDSPAAPHDVQHGRRQRGRARQELLPPARARRPGRQARPAL